MEGLCVCIGNRRLLALGKGRAGKRRRGALMKEGDDEHAQRRGTAFLETHTE